MGGLGQNGGEGELSVGEIAELLAVAQPKLSAQTTSPACAGAASRHRQDETCDRGHPDPPGHAKGPSRRARLDHGQESFVARTNDSGFYSALLKKGAYTVAYSPAAKYVSKSPNSVRAVLGKTARVNFVLKEKHKQELTAVDRNGRGDKSEVDAPVGHEIGIIGDDWDPHGSPMVLTYGSKQFDTVQPTARRWSRNPRVEPYPDGRCRTAIRVTQDETARSVVLRAQPVAAVLFTDGDAGVKNGRRTKAGTYVCEGEEIQVNPGAVGVHVSLDRRVTGFDGMHIDNQQREVAVYGGLFAPSVVIPLKSGKRVRIPGLDGGDIARYDPSGRKGLSSLPADTGPTTVSGFLRRDGDLHVSGRFSLDGAVVYVTGNVTIDGGLEGTGALIVAGSVTVRGDVSLRPHGSTSIRAGGPVVFHGP